MVNDTQRFFLLIVAAIIVGFVIEAVRQFGNARAAWGLVIIITLGVMAANGEKVTSLLKGDIS